MQLKILMLEDSRHEAEFIEKVLRKEKIDFISKRVEFADSYVSTKVIDNDVVNAQSIFRQVTERKKAEDTLRQHEAYYRALVEHGSYLKTLMSAEGVLSYVSPSITKILGFTQEECIGKSLFEMIHMEESPRMTEMMKQLMKTPGKSFYLQLRVHHKNNSYRWCEGTITNLLNDSHVNALVLNLRDISEKNKTEDTLRESEQFHRVITNISTIGIAWATIDKKIVNANNSMCQMLGYSLAEIKGLSFNDLTHPDDHFIDQDELDRMIEGSIDGYKIEKRYLTKDGDVIWVNLNISCSRDPLGKIQYLIGIAEDISSRKEAEEAQQKSEANLRTILDNTEISYILLDKELHIVSYNNYATREYMEALGKPLKEGDFIGDFILDEPKETSLEMYNRVINGEYIQYEGNYMRTDGSICWHSRKLSPVKDSYNAIMGMVVSMRDITSTKLAELEREKMISDIAERNKDLEQFAYIVSHNLRAPVANIMGLSDAISNYTLNESEKLEMLGGLSGSVKKLDSVIMDLNQILHTKRQLNEQKEKIYFSNLIDEIKVQVRPLVKKQNVKIVTNFNSVDELFTIKSYLYSIFYNLISNSIKFHKPGVLPVIEISSKKPGEKIVLTFKDNGLGIDLPKKKDQVFGLYKRFHTHVEGKGIGLYMCKVHVEALGGKISIKSKPNEGTTVTIEFPSR
ncbi:MAG TPA: PAS domain S-box protein [Bacteroidia bacterium]|nr:PAS domain S-box protein [Bacteroidia bacterium]